MTGTIAAGILLGVVNLLFGVGLGWYLRRANSWCPHCGDRLTCSGCGGHTAWPPPRKNEHSAR